MKLAESLDDVQAFFVTSDYEIHYTRDFQKNQSYGNRINLSLMT